MEDIPTDVVPAEEPIVETEAPGPTPEEPEPAAPVAEPEPEDEEPPVRKSAKDYIIERKDKKIAKLEGENDPADPAQPDIRDVIREELAPITSTFAKTADEQELQAAFTKFPEAKKIEKTVRRYMENEAYARVPVDVIVRSLLYGKTAAKEKADTEAKGTRQGGHTRRPTEQKQKSAWEMTDKEFETTVTNVMSGKVQI